MFSIMLFSMVFVLYPRAEVSARRIEELLDAEPMVTDPENGVQETAQRGLVEFDHVTFVYPQSSEAILTMSPLRQRLAKQWRLSAARAVEKAH